MIGVRFIHFQAILSKFLLKVGRVLSYPFFKFKIPLGYPKMLMIVNFIII